MFTRHPRAKYKGVKFYIQHLPPLTRNWLIIWRLSKQEINELKKDIFFMRQLYILGIEASKIYKVQETVAWIEAFFLSKEEISWF